MTTPTVRSKNRKEARPATPKSSFGAKAIEGNRWVLNDDVNPSRDDTKQCNQLRGKLLLAVWIALSKDIKLRFDSVSVYERVA